MAKDLAEDCWELILSRFDHHSQFESLSLVSKTFLSLTNRLRFMFAVTDPAILIHGTVSKFFNRFQNLKALDFSNFHGDLDILIITALNLEYLDISNQKSMPVLVKKMKNLKVLKCANLGQLSDTDLVSIVVMLPSLEDLDISYPNNDDLNLPLFTHVTDVGIETLWSSLRNLRRLNISGNHFITDRSVVGLSLNCLFLSELVILDCSFITYHSFPFILGNCHELNAVTMKTIMIPPPVSYTYGRVLRSLHFSESIISNEFLNSIAKACLPLKSLSLSCCTGFTFSGFSQLLYAYQSLEHLALEEAHYLTDGSMNELAQFLAHLVSINLVSCSRLTNLALFTLVSKCPSLENIEMSINYVAEVDFFTDTMKNQQIISLNLSKSLHISDTFLKCIALACPNLELLNISSTNGTTERGIAEILKICRGIRNLQIIDCGNIMDLGPGLKLPKLEVVSVARSGFGDKGLETISKRCPGLLKLDLEGCVAATTKRVEELVRNCERLREINLKGCCQVNVFSVATSIVASRPYLKVIPPCISFTDNQQKHLARHGCLLSCK